MQVEERTATRTRKITPLQFGALLASVAGAVGFLLSIHAPARLWQILTALFTFNFTNILERETPFDRLDVPFPLFPLFALILWLGGAIILVVSRELRAPNTKDSQLTANNKQTERTLINNRQSAIIGFVLLTVAIVTAFYTRAGALLPHSNGRLPASDFDEMVYYQGSALIAQGNLPYRDFFLAHPPLVELLYGAFLKLTPTDNAGGYDSFVLLRWGAVIFGLLTVVGAFWAAGRIWLGGRFAYFPAGAAAIFYAADARSAGVATLETLANFFAVAGLVVFLETERLKSPRFTNILLITSGVLLTAGALCKLPGLAALFAVGAYLLIQWRWKPLSLLIAGAIAGGGLILIPLMLMAGVGETLRQMFFFQLLRPQEVAEGKNQIGRLADYPESALTVFAAGLALVLLTVWLMRGGQNGRRWLLPVLWSAPLMLLLIINKSFHPWYFVQWALPLALLGAGLFSGAIWHDLRVKTGLKFALAGLAMLLFAPLFVTQLAASQRSVYDKVYYPTALEIGAKQTVLAFDPGFSFMSAAAPVRLPATNKYLVDSAGYMTYLNLEIDRKNWGTLIQEGVFGKRERGQERAIFESERAQAVVVEGLARATKVVLDGKLALPQLTPRSVEFIGTGATSYRKIDYAEIFNVRPFDLRRSWQVENGLILTPFGISTSANGKANSDAVLPGETIKLAPSTARTLDLRFVWRLERPAPDRFKLFVHVTDERGNRIAQRDLSPQDGKADTTQWRPGDAYQDVHSLPLSSDLPPGRYKIEIGLYRESDTARLVIGGQPSLVIGYLEIGQ